MAPGAYDVVPGGRKLRANPREHQSVDTAPTRPSTGWWRWWLTSSTCRPSPWWTPIACGSRPGGATVREGPREGVCNLAIGGEGLFEVPDAADDPRFAGSAMVCATPGIRFAGLPRARWMGRPWAPCASSTLPPPAERPEAARLDSFARQAEVLIRHHLATSRPTPSTRRCPHHRPRAGPAQPGGGGHHPHHLEGHHRAGQPSRCRSSATRPTS
jgi:hypothetical protein